MDIHTLQNTVRAFAAVRGWPRWHTPKNLAMALIVEAAELLEIFQWMTAEESAAAASDPTEKQRIGEEIADVQIYLLQMAHSTNVDLAAAVLDKLQRNARRYPAPDGATDVSLPALPVAPQDGQPVTHVLVDYENVQPTEAQVRALVPQATRLWVFHGPHQKDLATRFASFEGGLSIIPISQSGKNALDFHLSFYMGHIAARHPTGHFVVLANDKGYEPMLEHARQLHFDVRAIGLPRARKASADGKPATRKAADGPAAKKAPTPRPAKATKAVTPPPASPKSVAKPTTASKSRAAKATRPAPATPVPPATRPGRPSGTTPSSRSASPAVAAESPKPAARRAATSARSAAETPLNHRRKTAPAKDATPAADVSTAGLRKVIQGLRKLDDLRRPSRLARLRGVLKSLLGTEASPAAIDAALARLQAQGLLRVDAGGAVTYPAQ